MIFSIIFSLVFLLGFFLLYFLAAFSLSRICIQKITKEPKEVTIYIQTNGVHTDIVVPIKTKHKDWSKEITFENCQSKDSTYQFVGIGWGDKGFYLETPTWADLKTSTALKAATGLSNSAMHTSFFHKIKVNKDCKLIKVSANEYLQLINYIDTSFKKNKEGKYIVIKTTANYGNNDAFYEANGAYSLFKTCNTWANAALKSCSQKSALWTPFDTGIFYHYQ